MAWHRVPGEASNKVKLANPTNRLAQIETAIAIALWAISFPLIKLALQDVSPLTLIVVRFGLGGALLFLVAGQQKLWSSLHWKDLPAMTLVGFVGVTLHQLLQVNGQVTSAAGAAAFLASTAPVFIVLLGAVFLRERLNLLQSSGVLLATTGAAVVSTNGVSNWFNGGELVTQGSLLVLASAVIWAVYSILNRIVGSNRPAIITASVMMLVGVLFCLPLWIQQDGWLELAHLPLITWLNLLVIGILCTGIAHLIYTRALQRAPASSLAAIQNIEPVIAVIAAAILVGEHIHPALISGGGLILVGVYLAESPAFSRKKVM